MKGKSTITQILSPERASERKGMSTVEQLIWVNLYSLDLTYYVASIAKIVPSWKQFYLGYLNIQFKGLVHSTEVYRDNLK